MQEQEGSSPQIAVSKITTEIDEEDNSSQESSNVSAYFKAKINYFCSICYQPFDTGANQPLIVCQNSHNFCEDCIDQHIQMSDLNFQTPTCPICREGLLEDMNFIPNVTLIKTLQLMEELRDKQKQRRLRKKDIQAADELRNKRKKINVLEQGARTMTSMEDQNEKSYKFVIDTNDRHASCFEFNSNLNYAMKTAPDFQWKNIIGKDQFPPNEISTFRIKIKESDFKRIIIGIGVKELNGVEFAYLRPGYIGLNLKTHKVYSNGTKAIVPNVFAPPKENNSYEVKVDLKTWKIIIQTPIAINIDIPEALKTRKLYPMVIMSSKGDKIAIH